jgi:hypothetical protein
MQVEKQGNYTSRRFPKECEYWALSTCRDEGCMLYVEASCSVAADSKLNLGMNLPSGSNPCWLERRSTMRVQT